MRKLSRFHAAVALVLGLFVVTQLLIAVYGIGPRRENPVFSTFVSNRYGLRALYLLLRESSFPAERWSYRFTQRLPEGRGNLLVAPRPREGTPLIAAEVPPLLEWVGRGNALLLLTETSNALTDSLGIEFRQGRLSTRPELLDLAPGESLERHAADAQAPLLLTRGADRLALLGDAAFRWEMPVLPLYASGGRLHVARASLGDGKVYLVSDPGPLSNGVLDHRGNLDFFLNLLGREQVERVYFDEFHQGYGSRPTLAQVLQGRSRDAVLIHAALGLLAALLIWGRRKARPIPVRRVPHRSATEFVDSMALVLQAGGATVSSLSEICRGFKEETSRALGLSPVLGDAEFLSGASSRLENPVRFRYQVEKVLRDTRRTSLDRKTFLKDVRTLDRWRKGIAHGEGRRVR